MVEILYDWRELGLKDLDIILCKGESKMSKIIRKTQEYTGSPKEEASITHVATVNIVGGNHYVQESTTNNKWANKRGVQRNPMEEWLRNYDGEVFVRKLDFTRGPIFEHNDILFWEENKDKPYESGIPGKLELLLCALRLHRFIPGYSPRPTPELHCGELGANRIDWHKLWEITISSNRMPPHIWVNQIDDYLRCDISEPIKIKELV